MERSRILVTTPACAGVTPSASVPYLAFGKIMNISIVQRDLEEASVHLQDLVTELREGKIGEDDTPAVSIQLAHIMDHICRAWNCKDQTDGQRAALSQEEFERLSNTVPNFLGEKVMGEYALS